MNSFPEPDEEALRTIHEPLRIEVHLAPEDPRRADLERKAIAEAAARAAEGAGRYVSATSIGLFEQTSAALRRDLVRARRQQDDEPRDDRRERARNDLRSRRRHAAGGNDDACSAAIRSRSPPKGAAAVFYGIWPALIVVSAFLIRRKTGMKRIQSAGIARDALRWRSRRCAAADIESRSEQGNGRQAAGRRSSRWSAPGSSRRTAPTR